MTDTIEYQSGFWSPLTSEALPGAVPGAQNTPRKVPYGLTPELISGTAFTVPRHDNGRTWLYRVRPSVIHHELEPIDGGRFSLDYLSSEPDPNLMAWRPRPMPGSAPIDFIQSLETLAGAGDPRSEPGLAIHTYAANADMVDAALYNADGDFMLLPDAGTVVITTELGVLRVAPGEIAIVPRGIVFRVSVPDTGARGLLAEIYGRHFRLPERGVIGSNGLADERHFRAPVAAYEDRTVTSGFRLLVKSGGRLYATTRETSPFDVVGWHGNFYPVKYDLRTFNAMGTVTWDHPDPSIYSVLSAPLDRPGENLADLVVFPPRRWDVAEHTFRPPFYHRNAATEINSLVSGSSDPNLVFTSGGIFITPPFSAHGVSPDSVERNLRLSDKIADRPEKVRSSNIWLQFETVLAVRYPRWAMELPHREAQFRNFASAARSYFDPTRRDVDLTRE
jgi:homogentisate 1,2-dioxygenase